LLLQRWHTKAATAKTITAITITTITITTTGKTAGATVSLG
jgi:hypothetical protein